MPFRRSAPDGPTVDADRFVSVIRQAMLTVQRLQSYATQAVLLTSAMIDEHARGAIVREDIAALVEARESALADLVDVRAALKALDAELPALLALIPPEGRA